MQKISVDNSSTTLLGANSDFVGVSEDVSDFATVRVAVRADSGASGNLVVGFSPDELSWTETVYPVADPSSFDPIVVKVTAAYYRLKYENGGVPLTEFRVQSLLDSGSATAIGGGGSGGGSGTLVRQIVTLSASNIAAKSISIASSPANPSTLDFIPYGGIKQRYQVDYDVSSTTVSWSGLGLDGVLAENDVIEVSYFT